MEHPAPSLTSSCRIGCAPGPRHRVRGPWRGLRPAHPSPPPPGRWPLPPCLPPLLQAGRAGVLVRSGKASANTQGRRPTTLRAGIQVLSGQTSKHSQGLPPLLLRAVSHQCTALGCMPTHYLRQVYQHARRPCCCMSVTGRDGLEVLHRFATGCTHTHRNKPPHTKSSRTAGDLPKWCIQADVAAETRLKQWAMGVVDNQRPSTEEGGGLPETPPVARMYSRMTSSSWGSALMSAVRFCSFSCTYSGRKLTCPIRSGMSVMEAAAAAACQSQQQQQLYISPVTTH